MYQQSQNNNEGVPTSFSTGILGERTYTVSTGCNFANMRPTKFREKIRSGEIAHYKIGNRIYIPESAIVEFLSKCWKPAKTGGNQPRTIETFARSKNASSESN